MSRCYENPYKGYDFVTHSSGGAYPPFTAWFGIERVMPDGMNGPIETHCCGEGFSTESEAHAAANNAAREFIDSRLAQPS